MCSGRAVLHILGLQPKFILEPDNYETRRGAVQPLADPKALSELDKTGFTIVGAIGRYLEEKRVQGALDQLDLASSPHEVFTASVKTYFDKWRGKPLGSVRARKGIISEKTPRQPRERPRSQRKLRGLPIFGGATEHQPSASEGARSGHNPPDLRENTNPPADSLPCGQSTSGIEEGKTTIHSTEVKVKKEDSSTPPPTFGIPALSIPTSPPWLQQRQVVPLRSLSRNAPSTTPTHSGFAERLRQRNNTSVRSPPSRIPIRRKRMNLSPIAVDPKRRRIDLRPTSKENEDGCQATSSATKDSICLVPNSCFKQPVSPGVAGARPTAFRSKSHCLKSRGERNAKKSRTWVISSGLRQNLFGRSVQLTV
jgi:hypothetical protein